MSRKAEQCRRVESPRQQSPLSATGGLVQAAEDWLRKAGVPHTEVRIDAANEASQALFRSEGFLAHTDTLIKRY